MIEGISSSSINFSGCSGLSSCTVSSDARQSKKERTSTTPPSKDTDTTGLRLSPEQKKEIEKLKKRDQEVRTHEQAHIAAGGDLASPASYTTVKGPDNKSYATGGEVQIDISPIEGDPEKTIEKARRVRSAAMTPANPSSQDMQVASQAIQMESQARIEKNSETNLYDPKKLKQGDTKNIQEEKAVSLLEGLSQNAILAGALGSSSSLSIPVISSFFEKTKEVQYIKGIKNLDKLNNITLQQNKIATNSYFDIAQQESFRIPHQEKVANLYANNSLISNSKSYSSISINT